MNRQRRSGRVPGELWYSHPSGFDGFLQEAWGIVYAGPIQKTESGQMQKTSQSQGDKLCSRGGLHLQARHRILKGHHEGHGAVPVHTALDALVADETLVHSLASPAITFHSSGQGGSSSFEAESKPCGRLQTHVTYCTGVPILPFLVILNITCFRP